MSKKALYYIAVILVFSLGYSLFYINQYGINNDKTSIQSSLEFWLNRGSQEGLDPKILEMVQLDDTTSYITLFQLENGNYGLGQLIRGLNGKFKFEGLWYGIGLYNPSSYEIIDTNKGKYMVLYGGNPGLKIEHIKAISANEEFRFTSDVSKIESFIKYEKIPSDLKNPFPAKLIFYDKNNNEIPLVY